MYEALDENNFIVMARLDKTGLRGMDHDSRIVWTMRIAALTSQLYHYCS